MTINTNCNIRFLDNQFIDAIYDYSSQDSVSVAANVFDPIRSRVWNPTGYFLIDSTNNKIYADSTTGTIASGEYLTPTLLATAIQTALNAVSSNWTVAYSSTTYKFSLTNTGSKTIERSNTTNAVWDLIGVTGITDTTTPLTADEARVHQYEFLTFDLGYAAQIDAFCAVCPIDEVFNFSSSATIKIQANTIDSWTNPPLNVTLTKSDYGLFHFFDTIVSTYRFWRLYFEDKKNPDGPSAFNIGHTYLGDFTSLTTRNIQNGFNYEIVDSSKELKSINGVTYYNKAPKYFKYSNCSMICLDKTDKRTIELMFQRLGVTTPFYISIDPTLATSTNLYETTKYVMFDSNPRFQHVVADKYSIDLSFSEVV